MTIDRGFSRNANIDPTMKRVLEGVADAIDGAVTVPAVTATATELNSFASQVASVTTTATPATGTCGVQFVFKDAAGVTLAVAHAGDAYFSNSTGLAIAAVTSGAVLTNGAWTDTVAGKTARFVTSAAGLLGVTVTASTGSYYISFVLPSGKIITSSVLGVN
jgi:hypothetical protein